MTNTPRDLLARLTGFPPGPYVAEYDDETWKTRISLADETLIGVVGGMFWHNEAGRVVLDDLASLWAAAPDLHRELDASLAREAVLADKLAKAEAAMRGVEQMLAGQRIELAQARAALKGD